jgi:hypothetical protein
MIPKTLHLFHAGTAPLPDTAKKSIAFFEAKGGSVMVHNELSLPSTTNVRWAIANRQWSVLSDLCRHWAIKVYGGYYIDTDILLLKTPWHVINPDLSFFAGLEMPGYVNCAYCGGEAGHPYSEALLQAWLDIDLPGYVPEKYPLASYVGPVMQTRVFTEHFEFDVKHSAVQRFGAQLGRVKLIPEHLAFGVGYQDWARGKRRPNSQAYALHYWSNGGR